MKITGIRIGDTICNKCTKFPLSVVGLFEDGTVYLFIQGITLLNMGVFDVKIGKIFCALNIITYF